MSAADSDVPQELRKEFGKLRSTYHYNEITIDREKDMIFIEYFTSFKRNKIILHFSFNMNAIPSTIAITVKNISSKNKHNINAAAVGFMMSIVTDTFMEHIDNRPIYQSIECWDREFALKTISSSASSRPSTQRTNTSSFSAPRSNLEQRVINRAKKHLKEKELKVKHRKKQEKEYIVFLRFNQLFQGTQHKKEVQILEELTHLQNTQDIGAQILYGTPGIICIGSTANIIKQFVKKCNEIGRKAVISYNMEMKGRYVSRHSVQEIKDDTHHNRLLYLLETLCLKDKIKILHTILTGTVTRNQNHKKKKKTPKGIYVEGAKYEFNVMVSMSGGYSYHSSKAAAFYVTIFGQNENKLVSNHRFQVKRWHEPKLKFQFSSIDFLNKIGDLSKIDLENHGKESREIHSVVINVYQRDIKNKKSNGPSILAKQYKKQLKGVFVKSNSSLSINL